MENMFTDYVKIYRYTCKNQKKKKVKIKIVCKGGGIIDNFPLQISCITIK